MITKLEQNGKKVHLECTNKNDIKKLQNQWKKLGLTLIRDTKLHSRGNYIINYEIL